LPHDVFTIDRSAISVGVSLYGVGAALVTSVTGGPGLSRDDFRAPDDPARRSLLMLLNTVVDVGKGVLFFPILENHGKRRALAYLAFIVVEVVMLDIGVVGLLMIAPLGQLANDAGQATAPW